MNSNKNKIVIFFIFLLVIFSSIGFMLLNAFYSGDEINHILKTKSYSYLSQAVQDYIKDVYEETNEIVLTEKNKIKNVPYLNPKYIEYLELTDEEKQSISLIPDAYVIDYVPNEYQYNLDVDETDTLPAYYNLGSVKGKNFLSPYYNQEPWGLCWAFATIEQVESYLMIKNNKSYSSSSERFSVRQMDYVTSSNGISDYDNVVGTRTLTSGGNFYDSFSALAYGLSLTDDNEWLYSYSSTDKLEMYEVLNFNSSKYELNSSVVIPELDSSIPDDVKLLYMNELKKYIRDYGGAYVGTVSPQSSCGYKNIDGTYVITDTGNCGLNAGHAMHIIGWDDNYRYKYCDRNNTHYPVDASGNCSVGTLMSGTGAWILKNSWGDNNDYKNVYLTYSSSGLSIGIITSLSSMNDRTWDNNYYKNIVNGNYIYMVDLQSINYTKKINTSEKIEKVKFFAKAISGKYSVFVISGSNTYNNIKTVTVDYPGIYTIDLSDQNIILNDDDFIVKIQSTNSGRFIKDSISVFTSNVDSKASIKTEDLTSDDASLVTGNNFMYRVYSDTKNIDSNEMVTYSLYRDGVDYSKYIVSYSNNIVGANNVNANLILKSNTPYGEYVLKTKYNTEYTKSNIVVPYKNSSQTYYKLSFNNNGGNGAMLEQICIPGEYIKIYKNTFTRFGYEFVGWNTKADGSGDSYTNNQEISITSNLVLYAQWKALEYTLTFDSNGGVGTMLDQRFTHDILQKITKNTYTRVDYVFVGWNTKADGSGNGYTDNQEVNLASNLTLYAQWVPDKYLITFYANDGTNNFNEQIVEYNKNTDLDKNTFTRIGYNFVGWNTKTDGSGDSYADNHEISLTSDLVLYAQWEALRYNVSFDANGGVGTMMPQEYVYDKLQKLNLNTFILEEYIFVGWNTEPDGSGEFYQDNQEVSFDMDIILYAQWEDEVPYIINKYVLIDDKYIDLIDINTTLEEFLENITLGTNYRVDVDTKNIDGKEFLYTGGKTKIYKGNSLYREYINVVLGDVDGDGKVHYVDYVYIYNHIYKTKHPESNKLLLENEQMLAGDFMRDNKIDYSDYVNIYNKIKELRSDSK